MLEIMIKNLEIIEVSKLLQHEQIIESNLLRLKEGMLNIGQQVDPLIVDKKSKAVLDGNHRLKVLEMIKVPHTVCQAVDYENDNIEIGGWFPVAEKLSLDEIRNAGFKAENIEFDTGKKVIDEKGAAFMHVNKSKKECCLVEPGRYQLKDLMHMQSEILRKVNNRERFMYIADDTVDEQLKNGMTVLFRRNFTKSEVVAEAIARRPLPPKSTRHMIPDRIIRLNMRLGWLHQSKEEATKYLEQMLHDRVYNGNVRRYTEPVIVIY